MVASESGTGGSLSGWWSWLRNSVTEPRATQSQALSQPPAHQAATGPAVCSEQAPQLLSSFVDSFVDFGFTGFCTAQWPSNSQVRIVLQVYPPRPQKKPVHAYQLHTAGSMPRLWG